MKEESNTPKATMSGPAIPEHDVAQVPVVDTTEQEALESIQEGDVDATVSSDALPEQEEQVDTNNVVEVKTEDQPALDDDDDGPDQDAWDEMLADAKKNDPELYEQLVREEQEMQEEFEKEAREALKTKKKAQAEAKALEEEENSTLTADFTHAEDKIVEAREVLDDDELQDPELIGAEDENFGDGLELQEEEQPEEPVEVPEVGTRDQSN